MVPAQLSDRHTRSDTRPRPTQPRLVGKPSTANQYTATTHTTSTPSAPARTAGSSSSAAAGTGTTKPCRAAACRASTAATGTTELAANRPKPDRSNTAGPAAAEGTGSPEEESHGPHGSGIGGHPPWFTASRGAGRSTGGATGYATSDAAGTQIYGADSASTAEHAAGAANA